MLSRGKNFSELFKKYRLRAEFATLSELSFSLAEKGLVYEESILSHWQKGDRVPNRSTILKLIQIFSSRQSIQTIDQANNFLESAGEGYLTSQELEKINFSNNINVPFQVPKQIDDFIGRESIIKTLKHKIKGNIFLIHGPAGVGKSALAIQIAYLLKDEFPDGILWFRLDTSDPMDVLLSIAFAFGKDIGHIQDREIRASIVRTILDKKRILLIFDNVEYTNDLNILLPNNKTCSVLITSQYTNLSIQCNFITIPVQLFDSHETIQLFKRILGEKYVIKKKSKILKLAEEVGSLPLAIHILARELRKSNLTIEDLLEELREDKIHLSELAYGNKNLYLAINFSYSLLDSKIRDFFISLAVFDGKDFSIEAVSFVNNLSITETKKNLYTLQNISLVEQSSGSRVRIHPMVKKFIKSKFKKTELFLKAANYYDNFLKQFDKSTLISYPNIKQESDNVIFIFKKCYELHYWNEVISLWDYLESLLNATKQLNKLRYLYQIVAADKKRLNLLQIFPIIFLCSMFIYWLILQGLTLKTTTWNFFYSLAISFIAVPGSLLGFYISQMWGLFKSSIGRSVFFIASGLFSWGVGNLIWSYYTIVLNIDIPYPSLADLGFLPSYFFWTIGMIYLPHAIGGKLRMQNKNKYIVLVSIFTLIISYYFLVIIKNNLDHRPLISTIKLLLNIAYPLGGITILVTALIVGISFKFFGGKYRYSLYAILLGFFFQYFGDSLFSLTTSNYSYYNGGIADLFFTIGLSFITLGILGFYFSKPADYKL